MILEFSVGNFRSFKEAVTLSLQAEKKVSEFKEDNVVKAGRHNLLKSAVVYGANGSGKSNLFKALQFMRRFIQTSSKDSQQGDKIAAKAFKLSTETEQGASFFEIVFLMEEKKYRYGFEVNSENVQAEWLYMSEKVKEHELFLREGQVIEVFSKFKAARGLEPRTRDNALFLSVASQFNVELAGAIVEATHSVNVISGLEDKHYEAFTVSLLDEGSFKSQLLKYLNQADLGIVDIQKQQRRVLRLPDDMPEEVQSEIKKRYSYRLNTQRTKYNVDNIPEGLSDFDFDSEESEGTKKYFRFAGPLMDTLLKGKVLFIDELDARLHPTLTLNIVRMFNSIETNPRGAQLIFSTHDSNLLASGLFRRDQLYFTEKDQFGATDLYKLSDFKTSQVRKDANYERNYLKGRYGAIPFLGDPNFLFKKPSSEAGVE